MFDRLEFSKRWRLYLKETLDEVGQRLEHSIGLAFGIVNDVVILLDEQDHRAMKCEQLDKLLKVNKSWMEFVIDVTKVYQLKEKQRGRIAKD